MTLSSWFWEVVGGAEVSFLAFAIVRLIHKNCGLCSTLLHFRATVVHHSSAQHFDKDAVGRSNQCAVYRTKNKSRFRIQDTPAALFSDKITVLRAEFKTIYFSNWLAWSRLRQKVAIFCQTKPIFAGRSSATVKKICPVWRKMGLFGPDSVPPHQLLILTIDSSGLYMILSEYDKAFFERIGRPLSNGIYERLDKNIGFCSVANEVAFCLCNANNYPLRTFYIFMTRARLSPTAYRQYDLL